MVDRMRNWLRSATGSEELPVDAESGAWAISFAFHLLLMLLFAAAVFSLPGDDRLILSATPIDLEEETLPEEFRFSDEMQEQIGALADSGATNAEASALLEALESEIVMPVEPLSDFGDQPAFEIERPILQGPTFDQEIMVQGVGSTGATGAEGAVDRITTEILLSLDNQPTLVIWLFDQSGSLQAQREQIAKRFDRVYEELGVIKSSGAAAFEKHDDKPLLTSVAQFGKTVSPLTPEPTDDVEEIKAAVRAVTEDPGGQENVFGAIATVAQEFRHHRLKRPRRNVMIVVFTDEAGDDINRLDDAVSICTKYQMPVYVVGVPAPFGRKEAFVKYVHPDKEKYDQTPIDVAVDQGPESLLPERIKLGFIGGGDNDPRENFDSGFGPFGLTRLCYQTGGMYFTVHPNRSVGRTVRKRDTEVMSSYLSEFFDPRIMRRYRPDYVTVNEYREKAVRNRARGRCSRRPPSRPRRRWTVCSSRLRSWTRLASPSRSPGAARRGQAGAEAEPAGRDPQERRAGPPQGGGAALAGRFRPGLRPGAGRQGPHRGVQHDARPGEAGDEVQEREVGHLGHPAERQPLHRQRAGEGGGEGEGAAQSRRHGPRRHPLGDARRARTRNAAGVGVEGRVQQPGRAERGDGQRPGTRTPDAEFAAEEREAPGAEAVGAGQSV